MNRESVSNKNNEAKLRSRLSNIDHVKSFRNSQKLHVLIKFLQTLVHINAPSNFAISLCSPGDLPISEIFLLTHLTPLIVMRSTSP